MGNPIQKLSDNVSLVANADTWIEGKAIQQLEKTAQLDSIVKAVGMPDLHPGRGYPIGAAFLSRSKIYPALVGNDIGCGMSLWKTDIKLRKVNLDKFEKHLSTIDAPLHEDWKEYIDSRLVEKGLMKTNFDQALGTIGGGNHFAELQQVSDIYDEAVFNALDISKNNLVLLVHSGSRGLGESILRNHVEEFGHQGLDEKSEAFSHYMKRHDDALKFAELNRELIAKRILKRLRGNGELVIDVNHNLVSQFRVSQIQVSQNQVSQNQVFESLDSENGKGWIHRKGATPSDCGIVMIPGSRGDYSYLVKPELNSNSSAECLYSLAHGAGRKWRRSDCKSRLSKRYKKSDLERTGFGSRVICKNKALIYEEAPEAYKSISSVIESMKAANLVTPIARFKPVLTYKTQGGC
ncbi:RNA ligase RtcB family protein [Aliikangiella coralliicola]|uniref:tRNA-splicing ligase RtcB n=1 Tax=Aliikangiella coralliicola TaxID=2592383 RepID=A0A545UF01_9GAMM|nr:RNA ligase RtcB family protein [Aliikangiella coralliicola]TQV88015.1 RNA ligase RtcB family protein [Aliikangiella coralliicola]